jgi:hypothetical protein
MNKVISRIKGGLGNQLFCYAAARRLALVNNAELVIDDRSGFVRDQLYNRKYALDRFNISARKVTFSESLEPFERYRRGMMKWLSRRQPFAERQYLEQKDNNFDERLLSLNMKGTLYLDGLWQSERYFLDVAQTIRDDLRILPPTDAANQRMAEDICNSNAVALHVRWFDAPGSKATQNVSADYYGRAIALIEEKIDLPRYFIFSDDTEAANAKLTLPKGRVTFVSHNKGDENAYADLWLMTQCQHFISSNSTFSWWGAWLGANSDSVVISPDDRTEDGALWAWSFMAQLPSGWLKL